MYTQKSKPVTADDFNEQEAQTWFESHALEAYEAFGQHADAIRNPPPVVTINSKTR
ncbi:MAG: hypothetical protein IH898_08955 [Planctomycetes bacterium]|nr:hypothetical protein [Planctomycetota bacterium]